VLVYETGIQLKDAHSSTNKHDAPLLIGFSVSSSVELKPVSYHVRPAGFLDLPQVTDVLASSFYSALGWRRWFYPVLRFSIYEDLKTRLQSTQRHYRCLAAIAPHQPPTVDWVIGTVEISYRQSQFWTWNRPAQVYLSNLAVREGFRRRGVARLLLEASEQQAREWGFREMYLHVMADNMRARQLYQTMGYQLHQVETTLLSLFNVQPARLLLKKELSPRPVAPPTRSPRPQPTTY
jgi:ribosomal protein S18 acetylase RimI-like enzyme